MKAIFSILFCLAPLAWGYEPGHPLVTGQEVPKELQGVGVTEHLGENIDLGLDFTDDHGQPVKLGRYFETGHPVLLAMVYYTCPNLCNYHLNGLLDAMKQLKWTAGREFQLVAVSMNHRENADVASKKKANYLQAYGRVGSEEGWHFLTGNEANVKKLADELGFRFKWIEDQKQYSHTSVAYVLTPGGAISRYLYGIAPEAQTLKLSMIEASSGKIGSVLDQVLLFCFHFDPGKNKYTIYAWNVMRIGAGLMVLLLVALLLPVWLRERSSRLRQPT